MKFHNYNQVGKIFINIYEEFSKHFDYDSISVSSI